MKVAFISNFLNHHQLEFCQEMCNSESVDFVFIATTPVPEDRLNLGYENMNYQYDFVLRAYESDEALSKAYQIADESDIVITGTAPKALTKKRVSENKITFRYMERILKGGRHNILKPRVLASLLLNHTIHRNKNVYLLCASAYTASDFMMAGAYKNKAYKWGYFPRVEKYDIDNILSIKCSDDSLNILWVGRFLKLKDPLIAIELVRNLKNSGVDNVNLKFIGDGPLLDDMLKLISEYELSNFIEILKPMNPSDIREYMLRADIFLFTSDLNEGWGAVLNEAMNSGCSVVASHAIGAVPFLLEDSVNGLIYESGKLASLESKVTHLIRNKELITEYGKKAYLTITEVWNAKVATKNLLILFNSLLQGSEVEIQNGPVSRAGWVSDKYNL